MQSLLTAVPSGPVGVASCSSSRPTVASQRCACLVGGTQQRRARRLVAARAEGESGAQQDSAPATTAPALAAEDDDDGDLLVEKQLRAKRKKASKPQASAPQQTGPRVISEVREQVYGGGPLTFEQQVEGAVVSFLGLLFLGILAEGIFLSASGFLSEGADQFATNVVYPAFAPTVGFFLAVSSGYGLWKTRDAPEEKTK